MKEIVLAILLPFLAAEDYNVRESSGKILIYLNNEFDFRKELNVVVDDPEVKRLYHFALREYKNIKYKRTNYNLICEKDVDVKLKLIMTEVYTEYSSSFHETRAWASWQDMLLDVTDETVNRAFTEGFTRKQIEKLLETP
jgi:hypothetical protein